MAETWLGAFAWAPGSQKCRGMSPALPPKPIKAVTMMTVAYGRVWEREWTSGNMNVPLVLRSRENMTNSAMVPVWVAMR